jgi:hypothetical protein
MAKSILKVNTRPAQTYALIAAAITTAMAVLASGLNAVDETTFKWLHQLSLVAMLASYCVFILSIRMMRRVKPLTMALQEDQLRIEGIHSTQIVSIQPKNEPAIASKSSAPILGDGSGARSMVTRPLEAMPRRYKHSVRVVVVRHAPVCREVLEILSHFPNVSVLDVQGCSVDPAVWCELAHLEHLKIILACGAVPESDQRDLPLTLPEIEFVMQPTSLVRESVGATHGGEVKRRTMSRT